MAKRINNFHRPGPPNPRRPLRQLLPNRRAPRFLPWRPRPKSYPLCRDQGTASPTRPHNRSLCRPPRMTCRLSRPLGQRLPAPRRHRRPCSRPRQLRRPWSLKPSPRQGRLLTRQFRWQPPIRPRSLRRHGQRRLPISSRRVSSRRLRLVPRKLPARASLPQSDPRLWNQGNHFPRPHPRFRPRKGQTQRPSPGHVDRRAGRRGARRASSR